MAGTARNRPDKDGTHRLAFERNKKKIYATQSVCGICGRPVDFTIRYPAPLSPCIDHIIPVAKGGHPSDIDNLQLAHFACNRQKSDKMIMNAGAQPSDGRRTGTAAAQPETVGNRNLPLSMNWMEYRAAR